jgi:hypothetical protein
MIKPCLALTLALSLTGLVVAQDTTPQSSAQVFSPYFSPRDAKPATDAQKRQLIATICATTDRKSEWFSCTFSKDYPLSLEGRDGRSFKPQNILEGSFSAAGRQEVLLNFYLQNTECCFGPTMLFEQRKGRWQFIRSFDDDIGGCLKLRANDGLDQLGCAQRFQFQGQRAVTALSWRKLSADRPDFFAVLARLPENAPACPGSDLVESEAPYQESTLRTWGRQDEDKDGKLDLVVVVGQRRWQSPNLAQACAEATPALKTYRLVFVLRDSGLMATESTRVLVKQLGIGSL